MLKPKLQKNFILYSQTLDTSFPTKETSHPTKETSFLTIGDKSFDFWPISLKNCLKIVRELYSKKPTVPCKILACAIIDGDQIPAPLIINQCLSKWVFLTMLKRAIITAIYKKNYLKEPVNYRAIWIITSVSNLLEKACTEKLKIILRVGN